MSDVIKELTNTIEYLKSCVRAANEKCQRAEEARVFAEQNYHKLVQARAITRRSLQKEIIASLRREEPWMFED